MHFAITLLFGEGGTGGLVLSFPVGGRGLTTPTQQVFLLGRGGPSPTNSKSAPVGRGGGRGLVLFFCRKVLKKSDAATAVQQCKISLCISTKLNYGGADSFKIQHTFVDECLSLSVSCV